MSGTSGTSIAHDAPPGHRHRWLALPCIALAVSIIIMDATIVNVSVPVIIEALDLDASQAEWMNSVYSLVFAALLITVGRLADTFGRRRVLVLGLVVFGLASVLAAAAGTGDLLILGRLAQGLGGAMILPTTLSSINAIFTGRERQIAFAVWGSTIGGMAAVGPVTGGWLTTDFSWRWAFLVNVPVVLVALVGVVLFVPETVDPTADRRPDPWGVVLSSAGLGLVVFALIEGETYGWWATADDVRLLGVHWTWGVSPVPVAFALGLVTMAGFVRLEQVRAARGRGVLLDLGLLGVRSFRYGSIAALVVSFGEFGMLYALPLFLQAALGYTALGTGLVVLALAAGTFVVSGFTPVLSRRFGPRAVVRAGLGLEAVAVFGLGATIGLDVGAWTVAAWLAGYGVGVGLATAQLTSVVLADVPVAQSGQASGLQSTFRQLGSALGVAVLGSELVATVSRGTQDRLTDLGTVPATVVDTVVEAVRGSAGAAIPSLARIALPGADMAAVQLAAEQAMAAAARVTTMTAGGVIMLGMLATLALPRPAADAGAASAGEEDRR